MSSFCKCFEIVPKHTDFTHDTTRPSSASNTDKELNTSVKTYLNTFDHNVDMRSIIIPKLSTSMSTLDEMPSLWNPTTVAINRFTYESQADSSSQVLVNIMTRIHQQAISLKLEIEELKFNSDDSADNFTEINAISNE